jgi:hypothetical protein
MGGVAVQWVRGDAGAMSDQRFFQADNQEPVWPDGESVDPERVRPLPAYAANISASSARKYVAYTVKLPSEQLSALQSIWLELKKLYGAHSPDKSGMIQQAIAEWLRKWDGPERQELLNDLLEIREGTRRRQYRKEF